MKILFYAPMKPPDDPVASGERQVARHLIQALRLCGHQVELASRLCAYDGNGDPQVQQKICGLAAQQAGQIIAAAAQAPEPPDLWFTYHVYHKAPDWIGPAVARALGIPYVIAQASFAGKAAASGWGLAARGAELAIRSSDLIFSFTGDDRRGVEPLLGARQAHLDLPPFLDPAAFAGLRRAPLAAGAPLRLLTAAMMRPGDKLESYRRLGGWLGRCAQKNWRLSVAGDGPARGEVEAALAPLGADRVRYLGQIEQDAMPGVYAKADLFVWPAANESYGMAMLEAQAAGLPVIAGRGRGVANVVRDGETGLLTPDGDGAAFAGVVDFLLADATARHKLGASAARFVSRERGIDGAAKILRRGFELLAPPALAGRQ